MTSASRMTRLTATQLHVPTTQTTHTKVEGFVAQSKCAQRSPVSDPSSQSCCSNPSPNPSEFWPLTWSLSSVRSRTVSAVTS